MGTNNRQRRAAKKRRGQQSGQRRRPDWAASEQLRWSPTERISMLFGLAIEAGRSAARAVRSQSIAALATSDLVLVAEEAERMLLRGVDAAWRNGWQPAELLRQARRESKAAVPVVAAAIAVDHRGRDAATIDPRWAAQVESLHLPAIRAREWLLELAEPDAPPIELVTDVVGALAVLHGIGRLATLIPPPGAPREARAVASEPTSDPLLAKVRALLAQAESTTFPAEAETFTAKAQELMARHSIDAALVWDRSARSERPSTIRIPIDDPYSQPKWYLLKVVAQRSRCRTVMLGDYGIVSVVGFAADLVAVEVLFTSLLVQAQTALQAESRDAPPGSRARSRGFRASFLYGYADRIGERLREVNASVEEETGSSLLPVLASRQEAIDEEFAELFPNSVRTSFSSGGDGYGHARGRSAADAATIVTGAIPA